MNLANTVKPSSRLKLYRRALLFALAAVLFLDVSACGRRGHRVLEVNYVSVAEATLRDRVAPVYNRVGTVKNGERVEVLEREKRFSRVRRQAASKGGSSNATWWISRPTMLCRDSRKRT